MGIHIKTWVGSGTAGVTDMANAGKRGKTCRYLRVSGVSLDYLDSGAVGSVPFRKAAEATAEVLRYLDHVAPATDFNTARAVVLGLVEKARGAGIDANLLTVYDEEIKAIHAPREVLAAGVNGVWYGSASEDGVYLHALDDPYNEWTELTPSSQSKSRAYDLARKVWEAVKKALTLHEASEILRAAGVKLHGFCAID